MKNLQNYVETLNPVTFNRLMKRAKLDTDSDMDHIILVANFRKYRLVFYRLNGKFQLDEYGYDNKGQWVNLTATPKQIEMMERAIDNAEISMLNEKRREAEAMANADMRDTYSFIDCNFYSLY